MSERNEVEYSEGDLGSDDSLSQLTDHTIDLGVEGLDDKDEEEFSPNFTSVETHQLHQLQLQLQLQNQPIELVKPTKNLSKPKPNPKKVKCEPTDLSLEQTLLQSLSKPVHPEIKKPKLTKPKNLKGTSRPNKVGKVGKPNRLNSLKQELYSRPILPAGSKPNFPFENFNTAVNRTAKRMLLPANLSNGVPALPPPTPAEVEAKVESSPTVSVTEASSTCEPDLEVRQQFDFNLALIDKLLDNSRKVMNLLQVTPMAEEEIWATFPEFMNREDMKLNAEVNVAIPPPMLPDPWFERSNLQLIQHYHMLGKELKGVGKLVQQHRSFSGLSSLTKITEFIVDNLELLGLTGAHHPVEVDRANLWKSLNSCWFFALAKSKCNSSVEEQVSLELLKQVRVDLLKWGDALSPHGLVNYSVGLNEAELIDALDIVIAYFKVKEGVETPPKVELDAHGNPTPLLRDSDAEESQLGTEVNPKLINQPLDQTPQPFHHHNPFQNSEDPTNHSLPNQPDVHPDSDQPAPTIQPVDLTDLPNVPSTLPNPEKQRKGSEAYNNLFDTFINVEN